MPLTSDLTLDKSKFDLKNITEKTKKFNDQLIQIMEGGPRWYEVGAEKYRQMRWNGETPLPKPTILPHGQNISLPSRDPNRSIPCRVFHPRPTTTTSPSSDQAKPKGLFYHIHGGGWVLQSEAYQDTMLAYLADHTNLIVLSVGYRLAPEHPYPAGNEDCFDVGEYLVQNSVRDFGTEMVVMGGDSAGAHLCVLTCFHLMRWRQSWVLKGGLVLNFGAYELSGFLPHAWHFDLPLVLDKDIMERYIAAYLPNTDEAARRDPDISPFFADLTKMRRLPDALFTCGTLDCLMDDSVMMAAKWQMSGAEGILKIYPGAPHGFCFFPPGGTETTQDGLDDIVAFITERIS